jgi:phage terminase large subunit-like protein
MAKKKKLSEMFEDFEKDLELQNNINIALGLQPVIKMPQNVPQSHGMAKTQIPLPTVDPGFVKFCKFLSYPAYSGLFKWQKRHHIHTWGAKFEKTLVHRKAGKSVLYNNKYQWAIQYQGFDVLLLGWTARYKEIAVYVYNFFHFYGQIDKDKRTSPFHFRTINGGRFDCYLITSKETLGMHSEGLQDRYENMTDADWDEYKAMFDIDIDGEADKIFTEEELQAFVDSRKGTDRKLWIAVDDPIDMSFRKERHKEESLELHFDSTLYGIQPDKWSFTGTRKFEGDFFDFLDKKFGSDIVSYVRGIWEDEEKGELLCPEMFTHPRVPTYEADLEEGKEDLAQVREHVGEDIWSSDFQQKPYNRAGLVWKKVKYKFSIDTPYVRYYDLAFIYIDRATTLNKDSDYTGLVMGLRYKGNGKRLITHDYTMKISMNNALVLCNAFAIVYKLKYEYMQILMVVEKQGGGDDYLESADNRRDFLITQELLDIVPALESLLMEIPDRFFLDLEYERGKTRKIEDLIGTRLKNMLKDFTTIEGIHSTGDKKIRIENRLRSPIKNGAIMFLEGMENSFIVKQILSFPYCEYFDAIDSVATGDFYLVNNFMVVEEGTDKYDEIERLYKKFEDGSLVDPVYNTPSELGRNDFNEFERRGGRKKRNVF